MQNDEGNPYVSGSYIYTRDPSDWEMKAIMLMVFGGMFVFVALFVNLVFVEPNVGPVKKRQREALKAFIMKKEFEALTTSEKEDFSTADDLLNQGASDCLHGLLELFGKIEAFDTHLGNTTTHTSQDGVMQKDGISAAAWRLAIANDSHNALPGSALRTRLNAEEVEIAQMLFNAADLDDQHRITCTEFATLAVLMSATDASDADAQAR